MRAGIVISFSLFHMCACVAAAPMSTAPDYLGAIQGAMVKQGNDRRSEFYRCMANWKIAVPDRAAVLRAVLDGRHEIKDDSVLLEIGGSTWPRYDYIHVRNTKLTSSFKNAAQVDISGTALHAHLGRISKQGLANLLGRAYSNAMDAPCYFLSMKKGGSSTAVAVYGSLGAERAMRSPGLDGGRYRA